MDNSEGVKLIDASTRLVLNDDASEATIIRTQTVDDSLLERISDSRLANQHAQMGDMVHAASIPAAIVDKWFSEGFNIFDPNVGVEAILKRLRLEDMSRLIATDKQLY